MTLSRWQRTLAVVAGVADLLFAGAVAGLYPVWHPAMILFAVSVVLVGLGRILDGVLGVAE